MTYAALLLALATLASPPVAATRPDVVEFRATCGTVRGDYAGAQRHLQESGWAPAAEADHPSLATLMRIGRSALGPEIAGEMSAWRREGQGPRRYVVLTDVRVSDQRLSGCYYYDFEAAAPFASADVQAWLGSEPNQTINEPDAFRADKWNEPGALPRTLHVQNMFIPAGGSMAETLGFHGAALTMTTRVGHAAPAQQ